MVGFVHSGVSRLPFTAESPASGTPRIMKLKILILQILLKPKSEITWQQKNKYQNTMACSQQSLPHSLPSGVSRLGDSA
jgi:hypothetical protein